jgi:hypothetical protein
VIRLAAAAMVVALVTSAAAAGALLFSTVAKGTNRPSPSGVVIARTRAEAVRLAGRLRRADRESLESVDFRRYVLAAAFVRVPTPCHAFDVAEVRRRRDTLLVTVVVGGQRGICTQVVSTGYQVIELRRTAFGGSVPGRAALRVTRFR